MLHVIILLQQIRYNMQFAFWLFQILFHVCNCFSSSGARKLSGKFVSISTGLSFYSAVYVLIEKFIVFAHFILVCIGELLKDAFFSGSH